MPRNRKSDLDGGAGPYAAKSAAFGFAAVVKKTGSTLRFLGCEVAFWLAMAFVCSLVTANLFAARASDAALMQPGDAVVTGFSGIAPSDKPIPVGADPLDHFFIDLKGPSAQVVTLTGSMDGPKGQLVPMVPRRVITAGEIGQVFGVTMGASRNDGPPDVFLGATSLYGLNVIGPDLDGNGALDRLRVGQPGARWMPGQFGPGADNNPGAIWRVDGLTGLVDVFAILPGNTGPGIADIVFDPSSNQMYASELDMGRIYRIDANGMVLDSFDHGRDGRPKHGLAPVLDNGAMADPESPNFDTRNPETWGYTQPARRVWGMTVHEGRLYYAVEEGRQVWSMALAADGAFSGDVRLELEALALPGVGPITDMLFDRDGQIYLAQRGTAQGSYSYAWFATPGRSTLVRYRRAGGSGDWVSAPEDYAIGMPDTHHFTNGGLALGYRHDENGFIVPGTAGEMLWATGGRLRTSSFDDAVGTPEIDVHGLQGNEIIKVRPANAPPKEAYFTDYDGLFNDPEKAGHMGDVEIWLGDDGGEPGELGDFPAGLAALDAEPPVDLPPADPPGGGWVPPDDFGAETNLKLTKQAVPGVCQDWGASWMCRYTLRVTNTSATTSFAGVIRVRDTLLGLPPGSTLSVPQHPAPWQCWWVAAPDSFGCRRNTFLAPGAGVGLDVLVKVPKAAGACHLTNSAALTQPVAGTWRNTDPTDDVDAAWAVIPDPACAPLIAAKANLKVDKVAVPPQCMIIGGNIQCRFRITVWNDGPGPFKHQLKLLDQATAGTTVAFGPAADWACVPNGPSYVCSSTTDPLELAAGEMRVLWSWVTVPVGVAKANGCKVANTVKIVTPSGAAHPMNTLAGDDAATAIANVPVALCNLLESNLKIEKQASPQQCQNAGADWRCRWTVTVRNTSANTYKGPLVISETLPGKPEMTTWNAPWGCIGDGGGAGGAVCGHPYTEIGAGATRTLSIQATFSKSVVQANGCALTNTATLAFASGGTIRNTDASDDSAQATANVPNIVCLLPAQGEPKPPPVIVPPPRKSCKVGMIGKWPRCRWPERPTSPQPPPVSTPPERCPEGTKGRWPDCRVTELPKQCPQGYRGTYPECWKPTPPPTKTCPIGTIGKYPDCRPILIGDPPKLCPPGTTGRWPRCRKFDPPKQCPPGYRGTYPECWKPTPPDKQCPRGTVGTYPNCDPVGGGGGGGKKCRPGTYGKYPDCRPFTILDPPKICPAGTRGRYPNCKRVIVDPPKVCPRGTRGRWPRCIRPDPKRPDLKVPDGKKTGRRPDLKDANAKRLKALKLRQQRKLKLKQKKRRELRLKAQQASQLKKQKALRARQQKQLRLNRQKLKQKKAKQQQLRRQKQLRQKQLKLKQKRKSKPQRASKPKAKFSAKRKRVAPKREVKKLRKRPPVRLKRSPQKKLRRSN